MKDGVFFNFREDKNSTLFYSTRRVTHTHTHPSMFFVKCKVNYFRKGYNFPQNAVNKKLPSALT
jgi:hypothetical protein